MTLTRNMEDSARPGAIPDGEPPAPLAVQDATRLKLSPVTPVPLFDRQRITSSVISILFHATILALLVRTAGIMPDGDQSFGWGPGVGGGGGGSSGDEIFVLELPAEAPPAPEPPVEEEVVPVEEELVIPTEEVVTIPPADTVPSAPAPVAAVDPPPPGAGDGTGTGIGSGTGSGIGPGSGTGTGGGSGGGTGTGVGDGGGSGRVMPPSPVALLLPPQAPSEARGRSVKLRLMVDANGTVRQVSFDTRTGVRDFDEKIERTARGWKFRPARAEGRAVAGEFEVVFTF